MSKYQYPTFDDLTEEQQEQISNDPIKSLEYQMNKHELVLSQFDDGLSKERYFYRCMAHINLLKVVDFVGTRAGKYPELFEQLKQHLAFYRVPKVATLEFVDYLKPQLIELQKLLLSDDIDVKLANKIVSDIRNQIPLPS